MVQEMLSKIIVLSLLVLFALDVFSQESGQKISGLYYDSEREKYFSNEKSVFTIRPFEKDKNYLEKIEVSIDEQDFKTYDGSLTFTSEGSHQIRFRAIDPVLNWSPIQTFRIYVDRTPPLGQYVWKGPTFNKNGNIFVNPQSELSIIAQDNLSGINSIFWKNSDEKDFKKFSQNKNFNKEGNYSIETYAVDNVGNKENVKNLKFFVDEKTPETSSSIIGNSFVNGKELFVSTGAQIALNSIDESSGLEKIEFQLNKGTITNFSSPILLSESNTTLHYRGIDNVGNKEGWKTLNVKLDARPPRIRMETVGKSHTIGGKIYSRPGFSFKFNIYDSESGIKETAVSYDGKNYQAVNDFNFNFDKSGEYRFHLKSKDNVGNYEESDPYLINIDDRPPSVVLKSSEPMVLKEGILLSSVPNRLFFESYDEGVGTDRVEYKINDDEFKLMKAPLELSEWKQGIHNLQFRAFDRLGNVSELQKVVINVRTVGPDVGLYVESEDLPNVPLSEIKKRTGKSREESKGEKIEG